MLDEVILIQEVLDNNYGTGTVADKHFGAYAPHVADGGILFLDCFCDELDDGAECICRHNHEYTSSWW